MTPSQQLKLRNALVVSRDVLTKAIEQLDKDLQPVTPRKRRNLKAEREHHYATNQALGKWSKPKNMRKGK